MAIEGAGIPGTLGAFPQSLVNDKIAAHGPM